MASLKQSATAVQAQPVREVLIMSPPSFAVMLPTCSVCGEYLANHWRRRECAGPQVQP